MKVLLKNWSLVLKMFLILTAIPSSFVRAAEFKNPTLNKVVDALWLQGVENPNFQEPAQQLLDESPKMEVDAVEQWPEELAKPMDRENSFEVL